MCAESEITEIELYNRHVNGKPILRETKIFNIWDKLKGAT
jgi:hypothetical protein